MNKDNWKENMLPLIPAVGGSSRMRDAFENTNSKELYPLKQYQKLSAQCILQNAGPFAPKLLRNDDAISYITYQLMLADCYWNRRWRDLFVRKIYLWYCGKYAVIKLLNLYGQNKCPSFSFNDDIFIHYEKETSVDLKSIIKNSRFLTSKQEQYLTHQCMGSKQTEIARLYKVSRQSVNQCLKRGSKNLKKEFYNEGSRKNTPS